LKSRRLEIPTKITALNIFKPDEQILLLKSRPLIVPIYMKTDTPDQRTSFFTQESVYNVHHVITKAQRDSDFENIAAEVSRKYDP